MNQIDGAQQSVQYKLKGPTTFTYIRWVGLATVLVAIIVAVPVPLVFKVIFGYWAMLYLVSLVGRRGEWRVEMAEDLIRVRANYRFRRTYSDVEAVRPYSSHLPGLYKMYKPNMELVLKEPMWVLVLFPLPFVFRKRVFQLAFEHPESFQADIRGRLRVD